MPRMLFHRDFAGYTGGHGKVWDYFRHALALGWDAWVYFTPDSKRDASNPWMAMPERVVADWHPQDFDVMFLAGMDWNALEDIREPPRPVVNLLQHVRHASPELPLRGFLRAPAQRICVSQPVADAVLATGEVNGPVAVIPAALDLPHDAMPRTPAAGGPVLIAGLKAPALAHALAEELRARGISVELLDRWLPRVDYLDRVARAPVAVTLPHPTEGFYLPALEAMALGVPVVLGDCVGSREYTRDGENCLLAALAPAPLAEAAQRAMQPMQAARLRAGGLATAGRFGQAAERAAFAQLLRDIGMAAP
ncbi:glycosyltransferase [Thermomonas fusca]